MHRSMVVALAMSSAVASPASAGWFSYDSFGECVLDKAKGQKFMTYEIKATIEDVCREKFPCPAGSYQSALNGGRCMPTPNYSSSE